MATARILVPIDKAGRVVLPKDVRDHLGLRAGVEFEVIEESDRIVLRPLHSKPKITNKGGVLVVIPQKALETSPVDQLKKIRDERSRKR